MPSAQVTAASQQSETATQAVKMTLDLYTRKNFEPPWIGYLAEVDGVCVGSCGFAGPPVNGEAEIAYYTFPGNEGKGIASAMAAELIRVTRLADQRHVLIAHTLPAEGPSTSILRKLGFECLGVITHPEDGQIWKWRETSGLARA
ncbi:MAG: GNAT family N-acetyltransferase [Betaproteobacteria bacterium]|nr:GNAT family N-acetyltransferase [Betaproteobacteria bacterium]